MWYGALIVLVFYHSKYVVVHVILSITVMDVCHKDQLQLLRSVDSCVENIRTVWLYHSSSSSDIDNNEKLRMFLKRLFDARPFGRK